MFKGLLLKALLVFSGFVASLLIFMKLNKKRRPVVITRRTVEKMYRRFE